MEWFGPILPSLSMRFHIVPLGLPAEGRCERYPKGPCLILPDLMVGEETRSALAAPFGRSPFPFILLAD